MSFFKRFFPKEERFFDLFEEHASLILEAAQSLLLWGIDATPETCCQKIEAIEQKGDELTHKTVSLLHSTFITPIDRIDIHRLISTMDDVLDEIEDVAKFFALYKFSKPSVEALALIEVIIQSAHAIKQAMLEVRTLEHTERLHSHFVTINRLENEGDKLFTQALKKLFDDHQNALEIIKWKEVYEHLEAAIDRCEDVGNILEGIVLEYA